MTKRDLEHEVDLLRRALRWALDGNALSDYIDSPSESLTYQDAGCGCCAQFGLHVPDELQPVIRRALPDTDPRAIAVRPSR